MSWYRFEEGNPKGILRIKNLQVCWYNMERNGDCFDETFVAAQSKDIGETFHNLGLMLTYVETEEDKNNSDRCIVFIKMDNGDTYELKMEKVDAKQCNNFHGGRS